jgi:hypothetical protein
MQIVYTAIVGACLIFPAHSRERVVKADYLACNPERQFHRMERLRKSADTKALKEFTAGALLSGTCVSLKSGTSVFTAGNGKGAGIVRIRPKGSFKAFFTSEMVFE